MADQNFYSYESLLDSLKDTHEARKKQFDENAHLLSSLDRSLRDALFSLEEETIQGQTINAKEVRFNFDEFMNDLSNAESNEIQQFENADIISSNVDRKHVCPKAGCNKSYTSSHGLKYHIVHGHSKEKENAYKPFICTVNNCKKAYRNSNGLKYHMAKAHKQ